VDNADLSKMKQPPRFVVSESSDLRTGDIVRVTGTELRHMRDVMRLGPGAAVVVCGAGGIEYPGRIAQLTPGVALVTLTGESHCRESNPYRLILAAGMIRAARMDLLVEKAAELNAFELWPLICARSVVGEPSPVRQERWRRISQAATKQSLRSDTMEIRGPIDVSAIAAKLSKTTLAVTCVPGAEPLAAVIRRLVDGARGAPPEVVLAIGPEGDFTSEELAVMREAGFVSAGLGVNRLRSETAAMAALCIAAGTFDGLDKTRS
jgi:16S rRNA (uracil1498-N3)-methyltransferase